MTLVNVGELNSAIKAMEEELNSPCTEEMAAFDKFIEYALQDEWIYGGI